MCWVFVFRVILPGNILSDLLLDTDRLHVQQQRFASKPPDFAAERTKRRLAIASQPILPSTAPTPASRRKEGLTVNQGKVLEILAKKRKTLPLTL